MQPKSMLNKKRVMAIVIRNIIMNFFKDLGVWVNMIIVWIAAIGNVNQNGHLEVMPMHILNFILNFRVVFLKINARDLVMTFFILHIKIL